MKKLLYGISVSIISTLLSLSALADGHKVLTTASWAAPFHTMNEVFFPYMDSELKKCTNGTLSLKIEYNLVPPPALYDAVRDGVADLTWTVYGYTPGKFVTTMIAELPLIPGNAQQKSVAFQKTYEKYLEAAGEVKGVQVLANYTHGPGMANTIKKATSYQDLEGVKMRIGGGVANAIGTALGVAGVNAPAPKVYELISGATLAFAALLLIFPGFATDFVGILLVIPFTRKIILNRFVKKQNYKKKVDENYIDGDYEDLSDDNDKKI